MCWRRNFHVAERGREGEQFVRLEMERNDASTVTCIVSGASYSPQGGVFTSRELMTLFGQGLGPKEPQIFERQGLSRLPREASGTEVIVGGVPAPLLAVMDTQVNFMAPPEAHFPVPGPFEVRRNGIPILRGLIGVGEGATPVTLLRVTPQGAVGVSAGGLLQADALNEDGTVNSLANPAAPGTLVTVFFTGAGPLADPAPEEDIAGELPVAPRQFRHVIETKDEFIDPARVSTQPGRNKGVLQLQWRLPSTASGPFGFQIRVKTDHAVRFGVSHFVFVQP
jgi:uncharacterized protein (TIGR03437 family)